MSDTSKQQAPWWQPGLILFFKLSSWIAGPIIIAVFLGKYLDRRYGTEPWLFLATVGVSFIISTVAITIQSIREMKRIEEEELKKKEGNKK
jgi:F0F1-type ATP synthase assembly protein I